MSIRDPGPVIKLLSKKLVFSLAKPRQDLANFDLSLPSVSITLVLPGMAAGHYTASRAHHITFHSFPRLGFTNFAISMELLGPVSPVRAITVAQA